ncbi:MAG: hypothetical protein D6689_11065 [Deltaproteobacteria bacterium]|nr:MAG: hypothetical protein D6689_11065 [Deltaproteobacteria bacterium]
MTRSYTRRTAAVAVAAALAGGCRERPAPRAAHDAAPPPAAAPRGAHDAAPPPAAARRAADAGVAIEIPALAE